MSNIHELIHEARRARGWSMERLAAEVSRHEGLKKPLTWQTVQQWEGGVSAPKRGRMALVLRLLGINPSDALPGLVAPPTIDQPPHRVEEPGGTHGAFGLSKLLLELGHIMEPLDEATRESVGVLLKHLCNNPGQADKIARQATAITKITGKPEAQRSINSR